MDYVTDTHSILWYFTEDPRRYENFDLAPLDVDILKVANKIEANLEMHDRLIVATALYFNATLITKDRRIVNAAICPTIW